MAEPSTYVLPEDYATAGGTADRGTAWTKTQGGKAESVDLAQAAGVRDLPNLNVVSADEAQQILKTERDARSYEAAFGNGLVGAGLAAATGGMDMLSFGLAPDAIIKGYDLLGAEDGEAARAYFRGVQEAQTGAYRVGEAAALLGPGAAAKGEEFIAGAAGRAMARQAATEAGGAAARGLLGKIAMGGLEGALYGTGGGIQEDLLADRKLTAMGILSHASQGALFGAGIAGAGAGMGALFGRASEGIGGVLERFQKGAADDLAAMTAKRAERDALAASIEEAKIAKAGASPSAMEALSISRDMERLNALKSAASGVEGQAERIAKLEEDLLARKRAWLENAAAEKAGARTQQLSSAAATMSPAEAASLRMAEDLGLSQRLVRSVGDAATRDAGRGAYAGGFEAAEQRFSKYIREDLGVEGRLDAASHEKVLEASARNRALMDQSQKVVKSAQTDFARGASDYAPTREEVRSIWDATVAEHLGDAGSPLSEGTDNLFRDAIQSKKMSAMAVLEQAASNAQRTPANRWAPYQTASSSLADMNAEYYAQLPTSTMPGMSDELGRRVAAFNAQVKFKLDRLIEAKMEQAASASPSLAASREQFIAAKKALSLGAAMDGELKSLARKPAQAGSLRGEKAFEAAVRKGESFEARGAREKVAEAKTKLRAADKELRGMAKKPGGFFVSGDGSAVAYGLMSGHPVGALTAVGMRRGAELVAGALENTEEGIMKRLRITQMVQNVQRSVSSGVAKFLDGASTHGAKATKFLSARGGAEGTEREIDRVVEAMSASRDSEALHWARSVADGDEQLVAELMMRRQRAQLYLKGIMPRGLDQVDDLKVPVNAPLSSFQSHQFLTAARAIAAPIEVVKALGDGDVNRDALAAVSFVHPELKGLIVGEFQAQIVKRRADGATMPLAKLTKISFATGVPMDDLLQPQVTKAIQGVYAQVRQAQDDQNPPQQRSSNQSSAGADLATPSEKAQR